MNSREPSGFAYLDHAATTPVMPEVIDAMLVHLRDRYANPSGIYRSARDERRAIDDARDLLADVLGCLPGEVVFTSGGTESDNLAIFGVDRSEERGKVLVSAMEHHGVLRPALAIGATIAPVGSDGIIDLDAFASMLTSSVASVSVMAINNEVGTIQPIGAIVDLVRERAPEAIIHSDAVQALAWVDVATLMDGCDLFSVSAHKVGGPKGVGALVARASVRSRLHPMIYGGSQERDLRAGTENVAGIVGFSRAAQLTRERRIETCARVRTLRDRFANAVMAALPVVTESTPRHLRHPGNAHLVFPGVVNEEFLVLLDANGVAASAGSACASGALEPSHVLTAMGMTPEVARACVRFSLGSTTTPAEIDHAIAAVISTYHQLGARR